MKFLFVFFISVHYFLLGSLTLRFIIFSLSFVLHLDLIEAVPLATVLNLVPEEPLARKLQLSPDATSLGTAAFSSLPIERTRSRKYALKC